MSSFCDDNKNKEERKSNNQFNSSSAHRAKIIGSSWASIEMIETYENILKRNASLKSGRYRVQMCW